MHKRMLGAAIVCLVGAASAAHAESAGAVPIASGELAPYALADDGAYLYWASPAVTPAGEAACVRRVAKAGGAAACLFSGEPARALSLAFAGGKLFWGDLGYGAALSGSPGAPARDAAALSPRRAGLRRLGLGGGTLVWSAGYDWDGVDDGGVWSLPLAGGAPTEDATGQGAPDWVAADEGGRPYWIDFETRQVRRRGASGGYDVITNGVVPLAVQAANGRVYWSDGEQVRSAPASVTAPTTGKAEFAAHGHVAGFALDGTTLYVLTKSGGLYEVWRKPQGAAPVRIGWAPGVSGGNYDGVQLGSMSVLVDATHVYFADAGTITDLFAPAPVAAGDGVVYRVAK